MRCAGDGENGIRRILMMVILAMVTVSYADAGKQKCKFNGEKFKMGKEVLNLPDHCCSLMCASGGGKGGKPKHSGGILTLEFTPLASCTCQSPSRSVLDLKTVLNRSQLKRWGSEDPPARTWSRRPHLVPPRPHLVPPRPRHHRPATARSIKTPSPLFTPFVCPKTRRRPGEETRGAPGPQPSAPNMRELVWNQELADIAQAWCSTCPTNHDCPDCRKAFSIGGFVGQNLYWNFAFQPDPVWSQALKAFYDEVELVPKTLVGKYLSIPTPKPIGHYTQMVWAETSEVGCGAAYHGPCAGSFPEHMPSPSACRHMPSPSACRHMPSPSACRHMPHAIPRHVGTCHPRQHVGTCHPRRHVGMPSRPPPSACRHMPSRRHVARIPVGM
ncbi:SCP-like extracellular domain containing protein 1 [Penaeus vannamei]|uniref:SCP-like extracellular domain containing protein 1 n=1 Tax=Penaeus vannamei TaxID=6689 RepID=A0A423U4D1_PENVA|nr:SCP-like extracellular domain containing protein 1 [Penaeus vannamei]